MQQLFYYSLYYSKSSFKYYRYSKSQINQKTSESHFDKLNKYQLSDFFHKLILSAQKMKNNIIFNFMIYLRINYSYFLVEFPSLYGYLFLMHVCCFKSSLQLHIIERSMEGEALAKQEYDELLAQYSKKRSESENEEKACKEINNIITSLMEELSIFESIVPKNENKTENQENNETAEIKRRIEELKQLLNQEATAKQSTVQQKDSALKSVQESHNQLQAALSSFQESKIENLTTASTGLAQIQIKSKEQSNKLHLLEAKLKQDENNLASLEKQIENLQKSQTEVSKNENEELHNLQSEFAKLEHQLSTLSQQLIQQNKKNTSKNSSIKSNVQNQQKELEGLKVVNVQLLSQKKRLESHVVYIPNDKVNKHEEEIKAVESTNHTLALQIESLKKQIAAKKIEEEEKRKQQKVKKTGKDKKQRNYKQEINEAQKIQEVYYKELERQKVRYQDTLKLRKTYVSHQNFQILQKELERHQINNVSPLPVEQAKKQKLLKQNISIKNRIQYLKTSAKQLEQDNQKNVKELKNKGDILLNQKLAQQKTVNLLTNKLNQYMKEFPNHEKNKQERKNEEKRIKQEQKQKERQQNKILREKAKAQAQAAKLAKEIQQQGTNQSEASWDKWQKTDSGSREQTSLLNNKQFQIGCGVGLLLLILALSFA